MTDVVARKIHKVVNANDLESCGESNPAAFVFLTLPPIWMKAI